MVRGKGTTSNRNYTRVTINVLDHNDHQPKFLSDVFFGRVFETAAIGTSVVQVMAVDSDRGQNAEITYSILSGKIYNDCFVQLTLAILLSSRITAYLEVKILCLLKHENLTTGKTILLKRGEIAP